MSQRAWGSTVLASARQLREVFSLIGREISSAFQSAPCWKQMLMMLLPCCLVALWLVADVPPLATLRAAATQLGPFFPWIFFVTYVVACCLPIPRTIFTLSAGILFPPRIAIALSIGATTVAGTLCLLIVRFAAQEWVMTHICHPLVERINERLERRGWLAVASLRLMPPVPFFVLNCLSAVTAVRVLPYSLATAIGSAPNTIAVTLLGDAAATGGSPTMLLVGACCFLVGLSGLIIDVLLPPSRHSPSETASVTDAPTSETESAA